MTNLFLSKETLEEERLQKQYGGKKKLFDSCVMLLPDVVASTPATLSFFSVHIHKQSE